jgi:murein DD-endopeptidase MepM/ murein hydrolase activator NlpD
MPLPGMRRIVLGLALVLAPFGGAAFAQDEAAVAREAFTVEVPALAPGQGVDAPLEPTPDQRRQRARRLARSPLAKQRLANPDGSVSFWVTNQLHAPLTVAFEPGEALGATFDMLAPSRVTMAPLARLEVARVSGVNPLEPGTVVFAFTAVVGNPMAVHDDGVVYAWPFPTGVQARLSQGPGGPTHRARHARHALDFAVPEGSPVLAARAGVVVFLENRYFESGLDVQKYQQRANQVRILHEDGSMATYAHLFPASITLEPGQRVEVGERIGLSGNTGFSSGPHLHFAVLVHRDMAVASVPFRMQGVDAP